MLKLSGLSVKRGLREVVHSVSAELPPRLVTGVVGPNGSGKSSLLRALYGYLPPAQGELFLDGRSIGEWDPRELAGHLGVCPQEAEPTLDFRVEQVLSLPLGAGSERLAERLEELPFLALQSLLPRHLSTLSGGERQRVRLGLALVGRSPWLILDEPANHLDLATAWSLFEFLAQPREGGVVIALHDLETAARVCSHLLVLHGGHLVAQGSPREVLTADLLREVFGLRAKFEWETSATLRVKGVDSP